MRRGLEAMRECVSVFVSVRVYVYVSVTGPGGLIIQGVLNLHFRSPHSQPCLMVNTDEYCIFTVNPCVCQRGERDKCRVTERKRRR